jgi:predicted adenine nucleotide alpha hydrolase (AANH) superfamily ATPase
MQNKKLLLHCCCGPCSTSSIERLYEEGYEPILFFGNSNIYPPKEAQKRFEALETVATHFNLEILKHEYNHTRWLDAVKGHENDKERGQRCSICFNYNLAEAANEAKKLDIKYITTTLTVSPYKDSFTIFEIGKEFDQFIPINFKKKDGYKKSLELARELKLYRQKYCGCEFSKRDKDN